MVWQGSCNNKPIAKRCQTLIMRQKRCVDCIQGTILGHVWWYGMPTTFKIHLNSFACVWL